MNDNSLTQEEINKLMQMASEEDKPNSNSNVEKTNLNYDEEFAASTYLEPEQIDALGEVGNISMGAAATALFTILERKVVITTPKVSITDYSELSKKRKTPYFIVSVDYTQGFDGSSIFILQLHDVKVITDIMMGGDGTNTDSDMDEIHISAISEAMNQMMGAMSTSMATMFGRTVNISPPKAKIVKLSEFDIKDIVKQGKEKFVRIDFALNVEGILESSIMQLLPLDFAQSLLSEILMDEQEEITENTKGAISLDSSEKKDNKFDEPITETINKTIEIKRKSPPKQTQKENIDARPIKLTDFDSSENSSSESEELGIDLLLDVPLQVKVELGKCKKSIKDILELNLGSIVSLDKMAGEPVDVVVNGKVIAKGEVIVIDDSYGIRITEISSPAYRIKK